MRRELQFILSDVADDNRDKGKCFLITEMSAAAAEDWALRAFLAIASSGVQIPEELDSTGWAGLATMGIRALGLQHKDAKVLMDDLLACVRFVPDPKNNIVRNLNEVDIEEVSTRLRLKAEVFGLHAGFSPAVVLSHLKAAAIRAAMYASTSQQTSPETSGP